MRRLVYAALFALAACTEQPTRENGAPGSVPVFTSTGIHSPLAFESSMGGGYNIFELSHNGERLTELTGLPGTVTGCDRDEMGDWSPDGETIVFVCLPSYNIWLIDADGSNPRPLIVNDDWKQRPRFSHDGSRIAYSGRTPPSYDVRTTADIYVANADGTNPVRLTSDGAENMIPSWSPDDSRIVFHSYRTGAHEIFVVNSDGSNLTQLTFSLAGQDESWDPDWSPDGQQIAFSKGNVDRGDRLYVMNADGSNQRRLTFASGLSDAPGWSPDGTLIAFHSTRDNAFGDIFVMCADGTDQTNLTHDTGINLWPKWGPATHSGSSAPAAGSGKDKPKWPRCKHQ